MLNPYLITIGNNVTVTGARILTHDASLYNVIGYSRVGKVVIGDNVFIGKDAIILPNTIIGNNVIIGAGAVVAKDINDNSVVVGNPCKVICTYDEYLSKVKEEMMLFPIVEKYPSQILSDEDSCNILKNKGKGFMK